MKKHFIQIGAGNYTLCGEKLQVVNEKGHSVSEMLGNAYTFSKSEVSCEKCTKILNQK
jgi:hypothetical protein